MLAKIASGLAFLVVVVIAIVATRPLGEVATAQQEASATHNAAENPANQQPATTSPEAQRRSQSLAAFAQVATVLRHPRCLNCHPSGDRPHVGDQRRLHDMNVQRGPNNEGRAGLECAACHRTENQSFPNIPGTPHWHLAPRSMGWEGMDDRELATMLIDKQRNGERSFEDLVDHMEKDPLVLWGWDPGAGRTIPPISHDEFIKQLKLWFETGAEIPYEGESTY